MNANQPDLAPLSDAERTRLDAMIAARTVELRRMAALAHARKAPVLTREEIEFAMELGREAAQVRRTG
ncbi:MAG: hypothetical protein FGM26_00715 [Beijerinckiaceae bacterium]|nr:hypothetical protein [Beijerinckiaceae bacterium]